MNALWWNVKGLGNPWTFKTLSLHVRKLSPKLIFLSETCLNQSKCEKIRDVLGFENCFAVDAKGKSGGLMLLWKEVDVSIKSYTKSHIDVFVSIGDQNPWRFTCFYGAPETSNRVHTWSLLRKICNMFNGPWIVGGDLNEILRVTEKLGGNEKPN